MESRKNRVRRKMRMNSNCNCSEKCSRFCPKPEREMTHEEFIDSIIVAPRGSEAYNRIKEKLEKIIVQR